MKIRLLEYIAMLSWISFFAVLWMFVFGLRIDWTTSVIGAMFMIIALRYTAEAEKVDAGAVKDRVAKIAEMLDEINKAQDKIPKQ